jgi:hypothetical protein
MLVTSKGVSSYIISLYAVVYSIAGLTLVSLNATLRSFSCSNLLYLLHDLPVLCCFAFTEIFLP